MNIATYNCHNFKANNLMISNLMQNNDICFVIEHWLGTEEAFYFNDLCNNQSIIFNADFEKAKLGRGRPFGGFCWIINNKFKVCDYEKIS